MTTQQIVVITDINHLQDLFNFIEINRKFKKNMNCKLWNECKNKECLFEAIEFGGCLWSVDVCYALEDLKAKGLIQEVNNG